VSKSDGFANPTHDHEFVSPVELNRQHVQVRANALTHMRSVLEAKLRIEQDGKAGEGRFIVEVSLNNAVHPTWALKAELHNLRSMIETVGWTVKDIEIKNQCGPWLSIDMSVPVRSPVPQGPYR